VTIGEVNRAVTIINGAAHTPLDRAADKDAAASSAVTTDTATAVAAAAADAAATGDSRAAMRRLFVCALLARAAANYVTLTDRYTADPAPFVHDGRVYIYTSHDLDNQTAWNMVDYSLMSSDDLANWRDEGIVFDIRNQSWGVSAWAQQVIDGPGGFYMYYPALHTGPNRTLQGIGVAFSASVTGPFNDARGSPIYHNGDDPTVFRDDDGVVYLCVNANRPMCGRLTTNMTALEAPLAPLSASLPNWFEAPWLSKVADAYYLSYMCGGNGSAPFSHYGWDICYGSCDDDAGCSPLGPYTFRGSLIWNPPGDCGPVGATCDNDGKTGENSESARVMLAALAARANSPAHPALPRPARPPGLFRISRGLWHAAPRVPLAHAQQVARRVPRLPAQRRLRPGLRARRRAHVPAPRGPAVGRRRARRAPVRLCARRVNARVGAAT
jgi:hypothetical protein